jgi:4-coumarate--CoA ligase
LSQAAILRVLASLVATERATIGCGRAWDAVGWTATTSLGPDGLALDSLEMVAASDVVGRFFRLHETGAENRLLPQPTLGDWTRVVATSLAISSEGLTFATSGTTGAPKLCRHPLKVLQGEALFWSQQLTGRQRVVMTVAPHHLYGFLFAVLLPEITGWPVLDARSMHPGALQETLSPTDLLIGFPSGLTSMLRSLSDLPPGLGIVSATSSLPADKHQALLCRGAGEVIDAYGSSETGGIGARRFPDRPFELLPRWRRGPTEGSLVDIATGTAFILPDRVTWEGDRLLRPEERVDGAVQVAGVNVFPDRLAALLRLHPMLADCEIRLDMLLPEPRLRAYVVPKAGHEAGAVVAACDQWARRHLTAPERPVSFELRQQTQ